jgi:hypothetical protein
MQKTDTIAGTKYKDASKLSDPLYVNSNKNVEIQKNIQDESADIELSLNISINEDVPQSSIVWQDFLNSTNSINQLMVEMSKADNVGNIRTKNEQFESFYDNVAYKYYLQNIDSNNRLPIEGLSDNAIDRVRSQIHQNKSVDLQDIYDLDIRREQYDKDGEEDIYINIEGRYD